MTTWFVRNKRINAHDRAVFELYRTLGNGSERHQATIEVNENALGGIRVLLGALMPEGKKRAWEAIISYEAVK